MMQTPKEKGWVIKGACDRIWFLPYSKVVQDYKNYLMDADEITSEQADLQIGDEDISFWFYEQYIWTEVERDAILLTKPVPKKYKKFLDFYRDYDSSEPWQGAARVNFKEE
jgi:hypothetical protein